MDINDLERQHTLLTAVHRYDDLRLRDTLIGSTTDSGSHDTDNPHLPMQEALELLALGEVVARKAAYGRQLSVRAARSAGASWAQIARASGVTKQSAWEAHNAWILEQVKAHQTHDYEGFTHEDEATARRLAGTPD